jgi:hypothetical protein
MTRVLDGERDELTHGCRIINDQKRFRHAPSSFPWRGCRFPGARFAVERAIDAIGKRESIPPTVMPLFLGSMLFT